MNLDKIKNTITNFLVPIGSLLITTFVLFVVIIPSIKLLPEKRTELESVLFLENQLEEKLVTLNRLQDFQSVVDENADLVARVLVQDAMVPELLTQIDLIAVDSGLVVNKLSYSFSEADANPGSDALAYSNVKVSLGVFGNYEQITTFLSTLESAARLINVNTYRFSVETGADALGEFNVTFVLDSPYLKIESSAVTDDPIKVDVTDPEFIKVLDKLKALRFYNISVGEEFEEVEEVSEEEIDESVVEDEAPDSELSQEELDALTGDTEPPIGTPTP